MISRAREIDRDNIIVSTQSTFYAVVFTASNARSEVFATLTSSSLAVKREMLGLQVRSAWHESCRDGMQIWRYCIYRRREAHCYWVCPAASLHVIRVLGVDLFDALLVVRFVVR